MNAFLELTPAPAQKSPKTSARNPSATARPVCAAVGDLGEARELVRGKQWPNAWAAAVSAIIARPYHPEAYLLLGEIARGAGDGFSARRCAKAARDMAPGWAPPRRFLQGDLRGGSSPEWLKLPEALCDNRAASGPRVSVCLIVKNEERLLPQCLRSVRELAFQIVVVDTGSTDRTRDIAGEMGAEVYSFAWRDDFGAARNAALERARGDWILSLDADEELMPGQAEVLKREIQAAGVMGYRLRMFNVGHEQQGWACAPRLFRNSPGLYFAGRINQEAFSSVQARCEEWGLKNELGGTALLHHGYTEEITADRHKIERNLRLLERGIQESPGDPNLLMNLGVELVRSGKLEAGLERYWEAFRLVSGLPAARVAPEWREALLTQLATHLMAAGRFAEIVQLWQVPFANNGGLTAAQHFSLGVALLELKRPAEGAGQIRQCIAKRDRHSFTPIPPEIHKAGPHHCLALCLLALNDVAGAQQAFDAALAAEPASRPARFDLARLQAATGRTNEALKILRQMASENPAEARVWDLGAQIALSRPEHLEFARDWTAEAVNAFPENHGLLGQRAEALLLNQDAAQALPFWRRATASASPRQRAGLIICELVTGDRQYHFTAREEPALSQEAVQWYRLCIRMGARTLIQQMHTRMEIIRAALPSFVRILEAAHRQARQTAVSGAGTDGPPGAGQVCVHSNA